MTNIQTRELAPPPAAAPSAIVWIDGHRAIVGVLDLPGYVTTSEIDRGSESEPAYLAHVVRTIGDRQRVMILGPSSVRLALEREYVALYRRPDRLIDGEPSGSVSTDELVARLWTLAG
jgi:hypothetical protein